jgi:hypothetical protein
LALFEHGFNSWLPVIDYSSASRIGWDSALLFQSKFQVRFSVHLCTKLGFSLLSKDLCGSFLRSHLTQFNITFVYHLCCLR